MRTTKPPSTSPGSWEELLAATIQLLTVAARLTHPTTPGGVAPRPPAQAARGGEQRIDWAEFVSLALAGGAANLGGVALAEFNRKSQHLVPIEGHGATSPPEVGDPSGGAGELDDLVDRLEALRDQDRADYASALTAAVRAGAAALPGLQVPVIVIVDGKTGSHGHALIGLSDPLADQLLSSASSPTTSWPA